jgi:hypothetical protein
MLSVFILSVANTPLILSVVMLSVVASAGKEKKRSSS